MNAMTVFLLGVLAGFCIGFTVNKQYTATQLKKDWYVENNVIRLTAQDNKFTWTVSILGIAEEKLRELKAFQLRWNNRYKGAGNGK